MRVEESRFQSEGRPAHEPTQVKGQENCLKLETQITATNSQHNTEANQNDHQKDTGNIPHDPADGYRRHQDKENNPNVTLPLALKDNVPFQMGVSGMLGKPPTLNRPDADWGEGTP